MTSDIQKIYVHFIISTHSRPDRIGAIEALKATHREPLAKLDALFASLQHRAFRGEL